MSLLWPWDHARSPREANEEAGAGVGAGATGGGTATAAVTPPRRPRVTSSSKKLSRRTANPPTSSSSVPLGGSVAAAATALLSRSRSNSTNPRTSIGTSEKRRNSHSSQRKGRNARAQKQITFRNEALGLVCRVMMQRGWRRLAGDARESMEPRLFLVQDERRQLRHSRQTDDASSSASRASSGDESGAAIVVTKENCTRKPPAWDIQWTGVTAAISTFRRHSKTLVPGQRVNHFKNSKEMCRKDLLIKNLKRMRLQDLSGHYNFFPDTFSLPREYALFCDRFNEAENGLWIIKPAGSSEGRGISVIRRLEEVSQFKDRFLQIALDKGKGTFTSKRDGAQRISSTIGSGNQAAVVGASSASAGHRTSHIIQRYIDRPYLIGGRKFDLRLYALVTSFSPLKAYVYRNGFARFTSQRYTADDSLLGDNSYHLTNVAVQRGMGGGKLTLKSLKSILMSRHGQAGTDYLFWQIHQVMIRSLLAVQDRIVSHPSSFELYGFDILIDASLKPWLIEVNAGPSLGASSEDDYRLKTQLIDDVLDVVDMEGRHPPNALLRRVGGFDLAYSGGFVEPSQESNGAWSNQLGATVRSRVRRCRRVDKSKSRISYFMYPSNVAGSIATNPHGPEYIFSDGDPYAGNTAFPCETDDPVYDGSRFSGVKIDYGDCSWRPSSAISAHPVATRMMSGNVKLLSDAVAPPWTTVTATRRRFSV